MEVLSPGLIRGVRARLEEGSSSLEYSGVMLETGELDRYGLTPMSALPALVKALREGHMHSFWTEGDCTVLRRIAEDTLTADVWMDSESMIPLRAELLSDGQVRVFCTISNWN